MKRFALLFLLSLLIVPAFAQDSKENADFKLAVNLFNDKLYDLALEQFRQFVNLYPNTQQGMDARLYLGLTQTKLGRHDEARVTYQNFALTYPEHPRASEAWMNAAESFVAVKNEREAALAFERVKTFHPKSKNAPVALLRSAELYEQIGERENARRVLRTLTQEYATPDVLPARIRLASLSLADGNFEHARAESRRVADGTKDPGLRSQALILTARALIGMGRMAEANQTLSAVVKEYRTRPNIYEAFALLAELHLMQGHLDESIRTWKTIVDDSAKAPRGLRQDALLALGDLAGRAGELAAARQYYLRASAIAAPRAGESTYRAALASEELRDTAAAGASYQRMARDTTVMLDDAKRLVGLYKAARWTRQPRTMLEIAQEYQQRFPRDDTWKHMLVEIGFALLDVSDDPELARAVADDLQSRSGNGRWGDAIAFLQARIARRQGNHDKALELFETFERRYPGSSLIPQAAAAAREIRLFERIDRDAGLQKLASLVGGVIAEESRSLLAFRLGEIYFNELKDYPRAAEQYRHALSMGLEGEQRFAALIGRARSLEYGQRKTGVAMADRDAVLAAYAPLLESTVPAGIQAEANRAIALIQLRSAGSDSTFRTAMEQVISLSSATADAGELLLEAAEIALARGDILSARKALSQASGSSSSGRTRAVALFQLGKSLVPEFPDSATAVLHNVIRSFPDEPAAMYARLLLAPLDAERGNNQRAMDLLDVIEQRAPYAGIPPSRAMVRARALMNGRRFAEAASAYGKIVADEERALFVSPRREILREAYRGLALASDSAGNARAAEAAYLVFIQYDRSSPEASRAYYALAGFAQAANDAGRAELLLRESSRLASLAGIALGDVTMETADLLFRSEKYSEALPLYLEVIEKAKTDSIRRRANFRSVIAQFRMQKTTEADRRAQQFLRTYPKAYDEAAEFEFERGRYLIQQNQLGPARQKLQRIAVDYSKAPIVPEALYWLGRALELDQNIPGAIALYDSVLRAFPSDRAAPRIALALGNAYYAMEQWDKAMTQFRSILENEQRAPDLVPFAMNNLIMTYKEMEMFDAAMELTRTYISRYPDDPELVNKRVDIGVLYQKLGYYDQSIVHLQSLLTSAPPELEAELRYYLGEAYYAKSDYQQAILEYLKVPYLVARKGPIDWVSTAYYMAGQSYEKMGKPDQAITMYKQIIDRKDTDAQFKTAAQREIDRVRKLSP